MGCSSNVSTGTNYVSVACFWKFRTSVENLQVVVSFFPNVEVNEERWIGQNGRKSVQASECLVCLFKQRQERLEGQRRVWRQWRWHIGPEGLVLEGLDDISSEPAVRFGWSRHRKT